jgi:hypothetical protein
MDSLASANNMGVPASDLAAAQQLQSRIRDMIAMLHNRPAAAAPAAASMPAAQVATELRAAQALAAVARVEEMQAGLQAAALNEGSVSGAAPSA